MKNAILSLLLLASLLCAESSFKILEVILPKQVSPGQKFTVNYKIQAVELDEPVRFRTGCIVRWNKSEKPLVVPNGDVVPWKVENIKPGDVFNVTSNIQVEKDVAVGDTGIIQFSLWRRLNEKTVYSKIDTQDRRRDTVQVVAPAQVQLPVPELFPQMTVPAIKAPLLDGVLSEGEWTGAAETTVFGSTQTGKPDLPKTIAHVGHDNEMLYVAMVTEELPGYETTKIRFTTHDGRLWKNDNIEVIIQPDLEDNDCFQFIGDLLGQQFDAYNTDLAGYNPVWKCASSEADGKIIFEAAIPLSAVSRQLVSTGTVWRANFYHTRENGQSPSGWSPTMGSHNQFAHFGYLIFDSAKQALMKKTAFAEEARKQVPAGKNETLDALLQRVQEIQKNLSASSEKEAEATYQPLALELDTISKKVSRQLFAAKYQDSGAIIVLQEADGTSIKLPENGAAEPMTGLKASFFADETRHFAFNMTNVSKETRLLRCSIRYGEKNGVDGRDFDFLRLSLPGYRIVWRNAIPVATKSGVLSSDCMAENPGGTYMVSPGETTQVFLSVTAQKPQAHVKGMLVVEAIDGKPFDVLTLPVEFAATPVSLAEAPEQPFSFGFDMVVNEIFRERPEFAKQHYDLMREYGFNAVMVTALRQLPLPKADKNGNLIDKLDFSTLDELLAVQGKFDGYYFDVGIMAVGKQRKGLFGIKVTDPAYEFAFKAWVSAIINRFNEVGITPDKLVVCPYDESMGEIALNFSRWIKEVSPQTRILLDAASDNLDAVKKIDPYVDVWMPHLRTVNQEGFKPFFKYISDEGKPLMTYFYTSGDNEKLKSPHATFALSFWICYYNNLKGLAYWAAGQYYGDPWNRSHYPGKFDTALMYPTENGVIPSRRLMGWQRGFQDYLMLKLAEKKLAGDEKALRQLRENVRLVIEYPNDPKRAELLRDYCRGLFMK